MPKKAPEAPKMIEPKTASTSVESFAIQVPMADPKDGYVAVSLGRVDVQFHRTDELPGFRRLHQGLRSANVIMKDGKPVLSASDVLRWIMQQLTTGAA